MCSIDPESTCDDLESPVYLGHHPDQKVRIGYVLPHHGHPLICLMKKIKRESENNMPG